MCMFIPMYVCMYICKYVHTLGYITFYTQYICGVKLHSYIGA